MRAAAQQLHHDSVPVPTVRACCRQAHAPCSAALGTPAPCTHKQSMKWYNVAHAEKFRASQMLFNLADPHTPVTRASSRQLHSMPSPLVNQTACRHRSSTTVNSSSSPKPHSLRCDMGRQGGDARHRGPHLAHMHAGRDALLHQPQQHIVRVRVNAIDRRRLR